jgi:hypothetical protein
VQLIGFGSFTVSNRAERSGLPDFKFRLVAADRIAAPNDGDRPGN